MNKKNCPVCEKPVSPKYRPFCSKRCSEVDLGRWLGETYAIPTDDGPTNDSPEIEEKDED